jgi:hypothetical protein
MNTKFGRNVPCGNTPIGYHFQGCRAKAGGLGLNPANYNAGHTCRQLLELSQQTGSNFITAFISINF